MSDVQNDLLAVRREDAPLADVALHVGGKPVEILGL
jgi:hypothetical protein